MSDLDLGMNTWMAQPFDYPMKPITRGKLLNAAALKRVGEFARYRDVDGDGIPYRTIPGDGMPAYFTRGSGHNEKAQYSERAEDYSKNLDRLARKFETARTLVPKPDVELLAKGKVGIIAYGTTHWAIVESRDQLSHEAQLTTSYLRLRAYPFAPEVMQFIDDCDRVYVVEQNRDSQMLSLLRMECSPAQIGKLRAVPHYAGLPIDGRSVTTELLRQERGEPVVAIQQSRLGTVGGD
jgi:2-oxoglutarate ferredoxin oxidoreductase subunit alpha